MHLTISSSVRYTTRHNFHLKGDRHYVHGTDMFDFFLEILDGYINDITDIDICFNRVILNHHCTFLLSNDECEVRSISPFCKGKFVFKERSFYFGFTEGPKGESAVIVDYDENRITEQCTVNSGSATLIPRRKYTFIESLVALTKYYHNQCQPLEKKKWMFSRILLTRVPLAFNEISIKLQSAIAHRLTRSQILIDGEKAGEIFFSASN